MSVRRVKQITRAAKPHTCSRCGDPINKGDPYVYWEMGFRPSYKRIRCNKAACFPRTSERETSNVSEAYAAQEDAEDTLNELENSDLDWGEWSDAAQAVREAVTTAGEAISEVGSTYREADEAFGGQGATEHAERADTLETAGDELQGWDPSTDEPDACADHDELTEGCGECVANVSAWHNMIISEARDAVTGVELP